VGRWKIDWHLLPNLSAHYGYNTVYNIFALTFISNVSFVVDGEDGEPSPFSLPITAAAGRYDDHKTLLEDDGDEDQYLKDQEPFGNWPFDVYMHGNVTMLLSKKTKSEGLVKIVVSSIKGIEFTMSI
jgi:hypothetical protein